MKFSWTILTLVLSINSAGAQRVASLAESSGGGDNPTLESGSAWFLGANKTISACFEVADGFGAERSEIEASIYDAFEIWNRYYKRTLFRYPVAPEQTITTHIQVSPACDGKEDLTFYFGVTRPQIEKDRKKFQNPSGMSIRTQYDATRRWGKGYVWLASPYSVFPSERFPDWKEGESLIAQVVHEVGHVFGCGHVPGTVMDEDISTVLRSPRLVKTRLKEIDQSRNLVILSGDYSYRGTLGQPRRRGDEAVVFRLLTGRDQTGLVHAQFQSVGNKKTMKVWDDLESHLISFGFSHEYDSTTQADIGAQVFKTFLSIPGGSASRWYNSTSSTAYGFATLPGGESLNIALERNSGSRLTAALLRQTDGGPIRLKAIDRTGARTLFTSGWSETP